MSQIIFLGSFHLLVSIAANLHTIRCSPDPLSSQLGGGSGKLGPLQTASSSFGWPLIIDVGLRIDWPNVGYRIRPLAPYVIKMWKLSTTFLYPVCLLERYGV
jgi:hypothetical protein